MSLRNKKLTVRRPAGGSFNGDTGRWVDGTPVDPFTIKASVQAMTGEDMETLPEGRRASSGYWVFTSTLIKTVDTDGSDENPDIVVIEGEDYEAVTLERWRNKIINHYRVGVVRVAS